MNGTMNASKYRLLKKNKSVRDLRLGKQFKFQHDNDQTLLEHLQDKCLTVLEWVSQNLDKNPADQLEMEVNVSYPI